MAKQIRIPPPPGFPLFGWSEESIKQYINEKPLEVGDHVIIYNGQGGMHHYMLARVENPALGDKRESCCQGGKLGRLFSTKAERTASPPAVGKLGCFRRYSLVVVAGGAGGQ